MTNKVYRTAKGKSLDLGALQLKNEHVKAVGNMNVNARGDLVDGQNKPINSRNQRVHRQYNNQTTPMKTTPAAAAPVPPVIPTPPEDFEDNFDATLLKR